MSTTSATASPAPQLAAATRIVMREDGDFQIGIRPDTSIRVEPTSLATQTLDDIARGERSEHQHIPLLEALKDAALLDTTRQTGPLPVRVIGSAPENLEAALAWSGIRARSRGRLTIAVSIGEIDRIKLDRLIRAEAPHVTVRALDGVVVLGPFVVPGQTACLRCIDAHYADDDPGYPAALECYVLAGAQPRDDRCHDTPDPAALAIAIAWAARDLRTFAAGSTPTAWSSTVVFGNGADSIEIVTWKPHPACGCRWMESAHRVA